MQPCPQKVNGFSQLGFSLGLRLHVGASTPGWAKCVKTACFGVWTLSPERLHAPRQAQHGGFPSPFASSPPSCWMDFPSGAIREIGPQPCPFGCCWWVESRLGSPQRARTSKSAKGFGRGAYCSLGGSRSLENASRCQSSAGSGGLTRLKGPTPTSFESQVPGTPVCL